MKKICRGDGENSKTEKDKIGETNVFQEQMRKYGHKKGRL